MSVRSYESIFIADPNLGSDAIERLVGSFEEVITSQGGNITATNKWGKRTLAYEIRKFREGNYTHFEFDGDGDIVKELERRYRLHDSVLKFLTVRNDRQKKLVEKGTAKRQAKEARKKKRVKAPVESER